MQAFVETCFPLHHSTPCPDPSDTASKFSSPLNNSDPSLSHEGLDATPDCRAVPSLNHGRLLSEKAEGDAGQATDVGCEYRTSGCLRTQASESAETTIASVNVTAEVKNINPAVRPNCPTRKVVVILVDGTWAQARRMQRKIPASVPRVKLQPDTLSQYLCRRQSRCDRVSTVEAAALLLREMSLRSDCELLMRGLQVLVEAYAFQLHPDTRCLPSRAAKGAAVATLDIKVVSEREPVARTDEKFEEAPAGIDADSAAVTAKEDDTIVSTGCDKRMGQGVKQVAGTQSGEAKCKEAVSPGSWTVPPDVAVSQLRDRRQNKRGKNVGMREPEMHESGTIGDEKVTVTTALIT